MSRHRLEITLSDEQLAVLDEARRHEPRASFVKRAIEAFIGRDPLTRLVQDGPGLSEAQLLGGMRAVTDPAELKAASGERATSGENPKAKGVRGASREPASAPSSSCRPERHQF